GSCAVSPPKDFEAAQIDPLLDQRASVLLDDFPYPLPTGIVHVVGVPAANQIHVLQLIAKIPVHLRQMWHGSHVAMNVVSIKLDVIKAVAEGGFGEAIVLFVGRFNQARFTVVIGTSPPVRRNVDHSLEVADGI